MNTKAVRDNHLRIAAWGGAAALLVLPAVAMAFTPEVRWTPSDFAVFGGMLLTACLAFEGVLRLVHRPLTRLALAGAIGVCFLLVWAQLAVGII